MPVQETPAKINLFLVVKEERPDGYHNVESVILPLPGLADRIEIAPLALSTADVSSTNGAPIMIDCDHPDVPTDETNLCAKAVEAFRKETGLVTPLRIHLEKHIPVAAGLGGGSSDAAATLRLLNQLNDNPLPQGALQKIARALGADAPFFLTPRPALATGIGDALTAVPLGIAFDLILISPGFPITARWAYEHWKTASPPHSPPPAQNTLDALVSGTPKTLASSTYNALEFCAFQKFPLLDILAKTMLHAGCLCAHVNGSGPTLFGLCPSNNGQAVRTRLAEQLDPALRVLSLSVSPQSVAS